MGFRAQAISQPSALNFRATLYFSDLPLRLTCQRQDKVWDNTPPNAPIWFSSHLVFGSPLIAAIAVFTCWRQERA